ncbi:unnamed protein product [Phaedon cochleariae]|uniref:39S ribosomal protein L34, mitochondrial n=1 Tax=Phaedon cochleariae TaxID=80249 RepID=A0A9P0GIA9_PHACE|nr:unnamed protein product [Phaedon cochleariae]
MSFITTFIPKFRYLTSITSSIGSRFAQPSNNFHCITSGSASAVNPGGIFNIFTRTVIRNHFPRPSERRRIKRHGWVTRMKIASGRRVLMNRILKGRFVYSH